MPCIPVPSDLHGYTDSQLAKPRYLLRFCGILTLRDTILAQPGLGAAGSLST